MTGVISVVHHVFQTIPPAQTVADTVNIAEVISTLSGPALFVLALFASFKGWFVWGWQHKQTLAERDAQYAKLEAEKEEWKTLAMTGTRAAETAVDLVANTVATPPTARRGTR